MNAPRTACSALLLAAATLPAQGLVLRDGIQMQERMVGYDTVRARLVEVGRQGETHEFDGSAWLRRPGVGPLLFGSSMCYRHGPNLLLAFGYDRNLAAATWEYDGASWQRRTTTAAPALRAGFGMAHDMLRDRVVLFGGSSAQTGQMLGDTWEWDGAVWTQRATTGPQARRHVAMAYDLARAECVLFGGHTAIIPHADTWVWNGVAWQQRAPAVSPLGRYQAAMTHDPVRARTVLHGGFGLANVLDDLWEWDGVTWQQATFVGGPGPRWYHDMEFDSRTGESLLINGASATERATDVWQWNGTRWLPVTATPGRPDLGSGVGACAEPIGGGALVFGQYFANDTWRFAAGAWTQLPSAVAPVTRMESAMWSDGANAWLFGGWHSGLGTYFADTWRWTATGWQPMTPASSPPPRKLACVAFDAARNRAVLFGGIVGSTVFGDTWTFDGALWQQVVPAVAPPPRSAHAMGYDPVRARVVLFGGDGGVAGARNDTWEWDGATWWNPNPATSPPALGAGALEYDAGRMLLSTTRNQSWQVHPVELWSYANFTWSPVPLSEPRIVDSRHWFVRDPGGSLLLVDSGSVLEFVAQPPLAVDHGTACAPQAPALAGRSLATPGNAEFGVDIVRAPASSFVLLAASLGSASVPIGNCTLLLAAPLITWMLPTNAGGFATQRLPLPAQPWLLGTDLWFQAAALQPAAPSGFVLSAALRITVGQ